MFLGRTPTWRPDGGSILGYENLCKTADAMELMRGNDHPTSLVTKFVIMAGSFEFLDCFVVGDFVVFPS